MTIRKATLGACLLLACSAFGAHTYKVRKGDTASSVAEKLGVSKKALLRANDLEAKSKLKPGRVLTVPTSAKSSSEHASVHKSIGTYVVRNGDCDWTVAHKFGLTVPQLHQLNPSVDLSTLTIGHSLRVPGHGGNAKVASHTPATTKAHSVARTYTVQEDDNDWIIAKNVGTTPKVLKQLNPGLDWDAIQPGQKLRVPGSTLVASHVPAIHTRHAVIAKDEVILRRGPSTETEEIVRVDSGIKVTVIDHQGNWYKLHFPKGTEAWVRGDNLKPISVEAVAVHHRAKSNDDDDNDDQPVASHHTSVTHSARRGVSRHEHNARLAYLQHLERLQRSQAHSQNVAMRHTAKLTARRVKAARMAAELPVTEDSDIVADARKWIGTPYSYGSMSRGATDCSGFVGQVYRHRGVKLPRTSIEQSRTGQQVAKTGLEKGDLVFFKTRGSGRVSHVGMYVGNGNFIHASSGGGQVQISSLSDSYYAKRYAGARRVAKNHSHHSEVAHKAAAKAEVVKAKDEDGADAPVAAPSPTAAAATDKK